jgi:transposase
MSRVYLSYDPEQQMLLPPDIREWLPEGHLAQFISDMVDALDLGAIIRGYESGDGRGRPPYHPVMMVKLLVYGYCIGKVSSRKIEQATYEDVAFRVLACDGIPIMTVSRGFANGTCRSWRGCSCRCCRCASRPGW